MPKYLRIYFPSWIFKIAKSKLDSIKKVILNLVFGPLCSERAMTSVRIRFDYIRETNSNPRDCLHWKLNPLFTKSTDPVIVSSPVLSCWELVEQMEPCRILSFNRLSLLLRSAFSVTHLKQKSGCLSAYRHLSLSYFKFLVNLISPHKQKSITFTGHHYKEDLFNLLGIIHKWRHSFRGKA